MRTVLFSGIRRVVLNLVLYGLGPAPLRCHRKADGYDSLLRPRGAPTVESGPSNPGSRRGSRKLAERGKIGFRGEEVLKLPRRSSYVVLNLVL